MAFPSLPSIPTSIPSDAQKAAFRYLMPEGTGPAEWASIPKFANPLSSGMSSISSSLAGPGALGGVGAPVGDLNSIIAQVTSLDGYATADPALKQCVADINTTSASAGLNSLGSIGPSLAGAQSIIDIQTNGLTDATGHVVIPSVINNMNTVISSASAYSCTAEMFGDQPTLCSGVEDLLGSLGGAADELMTGVRAAVTAVTEAFSAVSDVVKGAFSAVLSAAKAGIQALIDSVLPGGTMDFSAITGFLTDIKDGVSEFVSDVAAGLGKTIAEMKAMIGEVVTDITNGLGGLTTMISDEIAKIGQVFDYLKNAAMALSWPSLNPCAKEVMKNVCGAAGAGPLVALVS